MNFVYEKRYSEFLFKELDEAIKKHKRIDSCAWFIEVKKGSPYFAYEILKMAYNCVESKNSEELEKTQDFVLLRNVDNRLAFSSIINVWSLVFGLIYYSCEKSLPVFEKKLMAQAVMRNKKNIYKAIRTESEKSVMFIIKDIDPDFAGKLEDLINNAGLSCLSRSVIFIVLDAVFIKMKDYIYKTNSNKAA